MKSAFLAENLGWEHKVGDLESGEEFIHNTIVKSLLILGILPTFVSLAVLMYFIRPIQGLLVLHYNVYFGVDLLGVWWQAYIFPFFGILFFVGHFFLAKRFYIRSERIAAYLLLLGSGMISFGILIASMSIALINY